MPVMPSLLPFQTKTPGLADLLNWAALVDDGIVQCKDGSLLAGYCYRGPDTASCTPEEQNYLTERINACLSRLGDGWVTWHDAIRVPTATYPDPSHSHFPDAVSQLIDQERRARFLAEEAHYESEYGIVFSYTPPVRHQTKMVDWLYDEHPGEHGAVASRILTNFKRALLDLEDALGSVLEVQRMESYTVEDEFGRTHFRDQLVNYLHFLLTGQQHPINIPPDGMYLDAVLAGHPFRHGEPPIIGDQYLCPINIEGFPHESYPNILEVLQHLPVAYRWSTRMVYLDQHQAIGELKRYRSHWRQKVRGFMHQVFRVQGGMVNEDALLMSHQAESAITNASSALVTYGYYTPVILLMGSDWEVLTDSARLVVREVQRLGFSCRIESVNASEAWLGSLPGHVLPNLRRPLIHTLHLADLLPLSSVWPGAAHNPCPFYPPESPPLLHAATTGATPFRLNLHVGDVGHTLVFGPTGSGKSTLLGTLVAQFLRYPQASIWAFDKGRSLMPLTLACGGTHQDMGDATPSLSFSPLALLESANDLVWAEEWVATCFTLQTTHPPTPKQREAIHQAIALLRETKSPQQRSLTDFCLTVQDEAVREALGFYTLNGTAGRLLDAQGDCLEAAHFMTFELEDLLNLGDKIVIPTLLYLFRRFEQSLQGQPALLVLDEAWVMLGHPVFREKIREWLKVLRKANCAVIMATQSLSDATRSGILDVLLESCPTKILLPNEEADKGGTDTHPGPRDLYQRMGLNEQEIRILKNAVKKRQYYYTSPSGRRLFELALEPLALAFVGASDKESLKRITSLVTEHNDAWPWVWLKERNVPYEMP